MLLMLLVSVSLFALAVWAIAKATQTALRRLGLHPMTVLLWLGLAEWPAATRVAREPENTESALDTPARSRRRSPHRRFAQRSVRRRPAARPVTPRP